MGSVLRTFMKIYLFIKKIVDWALDTFFPDAEPAPVGEPYCTIKGMWRKVWFYTLMVVVGLVGYFVLRYILMDVLKFETITFDLNRGDAFSRIFQSGKFSMTPVEWIIFMVTNVSIAVTPIIRYLPVGSNIISTVYFVSVGYNTSFTYWGVIQKDSRIAILVLVISLALCAIPYILFKYFKINLPKHFSDFAYALYWIIVMGGTVCGILSFIPGIGKLAQFFYQIYSSPGAGEFLLVGRIIIYCLFIFICLDRLLDFAKKKAPIKHEWIVTFHLMYTVTIMCNWIITFVMINEEDIMNGLILNGIFE